MPASAQLLVILVAVLAFWAVVMRPARNQQRQVQRLQRDLEVGQEIVLSSGIFGTVRSLSEARVEVEIAPGTVITVARQAVVRRVDDLPGEVPDHVADETPPDTNHPADPAGPAATQD